MYNKLFTVDIMWSHVYSNIFSAIYNWAMLMYFWFKIQKLIQY